MKKIIGVLSVSVLAFSLFALPAFADTVGPITFESPYTTGGINGQQGWSATGSAGSGCAVYDEGVDGSAGVAGFDGQSFRISNAVTSGCFGDQAFAPALAVPAGEIGADNGSYGAAVPLQHFDSSFDLAALPDSTGDILSVSPDRGDGSRMSYLRFENPGDGTIHVYFDDVTDPSHATNADTFNESQIAQLDASVPHRIAFSIDFQGGPDNDIVKISIDNAVVFTGTTWESYYRYDTESNPGLTPDYTRTVRTMLFRAGGTPVPGNAGKGYLIDNLTLSSSAIPAAECPAGTAQTLVETIPVSSLSASQTPGTVNLDNGGQYLLTASGSWQNGGLNGADAEYASTDSWNSVMDGYNITPYFLGAGEFDLQVDGAFVNWGSYNASHSYSALYTGNGGPVNLGVFDGDSNTATQNAGWYGDNSGTLSVAVYRCAPLPTNSTVHIFKYVDGVPATAESVNGVSFPMFTSTYNAPFTLGPSGWTMGDAPYEASTSAMPLGSSYSANENTDTALVGATCDGSHPYALQGYSTGNTLEEAESGASNGDIPNFTNLQGDKFIIVHNVTCENFVPPLKVHILKYLDGVQATSVLAGGYLFPMVSSWNAGNIGAGSGSYVLGTNFGGAADQYGADTSFMTAPADYATNEVTSDTDTSSNVAPSLEACTSGKYYLVGYGVSETSFADAALPVNFSPDSPAFTGLNADRYVVVFNATCPTTGSLTVEKDAVGGNATFTFTGDNGIGSFTITTAAGAGTATFNNLAPGTYHITEGALPRGWTQTDSDCSAVTVTAGGAATCAVTNTSNRLLGVISGTKYEDKDGDGKLKDGDNRRLSGWTIYLDLNNNGALDSGEPAAVTDAHGNYRFLGLVAGTYYVREVGKTGWVQTYPANGYNKVVLASGKVSKKNNFGNFKLGSISGMKYNDANGNGRKDSGETGLSGWTIQLKKGNAVVQTAVTDSNGSYSFTGLSAGTYTLAEVAQSGWRQTDHPNTVRVHSGTVSAHNDFGNTQKPLPTHGHDNDDNNGNHYGWNNTNHH